MNERIEKVYGESQRKTGRNVSCRDATTEREAERRVNRKLLAVNRELKRHYGLTHECCKEREGQGQGQGQGQGRGQGLRTRIEAKMQGIANS